jgi:cyclohexanecarboxyl-CoA dehydrogenase
MNFDFDDVEQTFQATVRRFALARILPDAARWDRGERLPRSRVLELGELGVLGIRVPQAFGGSAGSFVLAGIAAEELARGDMASTIFLQLALIAGELITQHAPAEMQASVLPALASGHRTIAFGLTETGAGSDAAALRTTARQVGEQWIINGEKVSNSLAGSADDCIVFARIEGAGAGTRGMGAILVPLANAGVTRQVYDSVGQKGSERGALHFDDVAVPLANQIGTTGRGFMQAMDAFDFNRAIIALACIGSALQAVEETIEHLKLRQTFGKPLARHQGVAFQIAEHLTHLTAARHMAYHVLWLRDQGRPHTKEAAMVKWYGPKVSVDAIHACLILHGWTGYDRSLPYEQRLRDVIGMEIGDGTPEIMKAVVAREIFGREFNSLR